MSLPSFTNIRIMILLGFLIIVGFTSAHQREYTRNWNQPLSATIYPINADGYLSTNAYIESLSSRSFSTINSWGKREAARHDLDLPNPINVTLGEQIHSTPPPWPKNDNPIAVLFWGLRFRWWAFQNTPDSHDDITRVRLFVMYHDSADNKSLSHSLGMQKGLMGLVHAFADKRNAAQNNVIIAHELLHTVGATDKYNSWGHPVYPSGYSNTARKPLHPQRSAEIMAGRIATSHSQSYMAESLASVVVNTYTAIEINWIQ
jgi:hypothetical protein